MTEATVGRVERDNGICRRKRNVEKGNNYPPELKAAKEKLIGNLYKYRIMAPYRTGVRLITKWCFPKNGHKDGEYRITKPDTDNLQKMLKDCMTLVGFWKDDALVASEITEKFWAEKPGIYIRIEELP